MMKKGVEIFSGDFPCCCSNDILGCCDFVCTTMGLYIKPGWKCKLLMSTRGCELAISYLLCTVFYSWRGFGEFTMWVWWFCYFLPFKDWHFHPLRTLKVGLILLLWRKTFINISKMIFWEKWGSSLLMELILQLNW